MSTPTPCPPIGDRDWPDSLSHLQSSFATELNVYRMMAHHPRLLSAWAPLRQHIVKENALGLEMLEVVILRAGYRLGSHYEWAQHVNRARKLGFSDARIDAVRNGAKGLDLQLVQAVDSLLDNHMLGRQQEAELASALGREAVFDLVATVGFYSVLGYLLMTYDTPLDDNIPKQGIHLE